MQLLIFFRTVNRQFFALLMSRLLPFGWWAQMDFKLIGCFATKWPAIFAHVSLAGFWWAQMDSDHRPHAYQACALTS